MKPVLTEMSNVVYVGPPGVGDLHCCRVQPGLIRSVWEPTPAEREALARGANVALWVWAEPVPPTTLEVVDEPGIGEDDPAVRERLRSLRGQPA